MPVNIRGVLPVLRALALALVVLSPFASHAEDVPRIAFERYRLPNGLEVILHRDDSAAQVYVSVWYHVGGVDEPRGKGGLAHLAEHMMFEGSKHVKPGEHFTVLGGAGSPDANASTSATRTAYYQTVPPHQLETALWLESDRMGFLDLTEERFVNQRDVVRNERRQNLENVTFGLERQVVSETLYPEGHPLRFGVIGRQEDLQALTFGDAQAFIARWYVPSNATLLVAGDMDLATTRSLITRWFGSLPRRPRPAGKASPGVALTAPRRRVVTDPFATVRRVHYVWPTVKAYVEDDVRLDLVADALARVSLGRLYRRLVGVAVPLAQGVQAYQVGHRWSGEFHVIVDLAPTATLGRVEQIVREEVAALRTLTLPERDLKQMVAAANVAALTGLELLRSRGEALQGFNHYRGDPAGMTWRLNVVQSTGVVALRDVASRFLGEGRVEIITMPGPGN